MTLPLQYATDRLARAWARGDGMVQAQKEDLGTWILGHDHVPEDIQTATYALLDGSLDELQVRELLETYGRLSLETLDVIRQGFGVGTPTDSEADAKIRALLAS